MRDLKIQGMCGNSFPMTREAGAKAIPFGMWSSKCVDDKVRALLRAIEMGEIRPHYQPIVDLRGQRIVGFEVLARWISTECGEIGPAEFIPLAASAGLLNLLTQRLLRVACLEAARWPSQTTLAINIAPAQFPDEALPGMIEACARSKGFPLSRLVVEITEDVLRGSSERAIATTRELRGLGVRLAMDDFGMGESNIRRLGLVDFDIIKIDRSVIHTATLDERTQRGLVAAIAVAKSLGLQVIAEGVEEEWQAAIVQSNGCSTIQGWLTGRPMPACDVPAFFAGYPQPRHLDCAQRRIMQSWPSDAVSYLAVKRAALMARTR